MPPAPRKPCRKCGVLCKGPYCEEHTKQKIEQEKRKKRDYDKVRGTRSERGYDNRWLKASYEFRKDKLCVMCEKEGVFKMAECTDHIIPHKGDMDLFWDMSNWQPLCISCNTKKAVLEEGAFGNERRV